MKKKIVIILMIILLPLNVFATKLIPGGETIGIEVHSKGVLVVGFYKVNNKFIAKDNGFKIGDIITSIGDNKVETISEMTDSLQTCSNICKIGIRRNNREKYINEELVVDENNMIKTGLYVKDSITGLGTLSFILENKMFAGLGHEIIESNTNEKFEIDSGEIYDANVTDIVKSVDGRAGEKNATYDKSEITGIIEENDITGIYGKYNKDLDDKELIETKEDKDINLGTAYIRTVVEGDTIKDYEIKIIDIDKNSDTKNILFEITDVDLLKTTGGVVQGMSGSPILQDDKMIGVVNYVIVNDPKKGYGIFVSKMIDKIN